MKELDRVIEDRGRRDFGVGLEWVWIDTRPSTRLCLPERAVLEVPAGQVQRLGTQSVQLQWLRHQLLFWWDSQRHGHLVYLHSQQPALLLEDYSGYSQSQSTRPPLSAQ